MASIPGAFVASLFLGEKMPGMAGKGHAGSDGTLYTLSLVNVRHDKKYKKLMAEFLLPISYTSQILRTNYSSIFLHTDQYLYCIVKQVLLKY
jgi:hypothetical protein